MLNFFRERLVSTLARITYLIYISKINDFDPKSFLAPHHLFSFDLNE